MMPEFVAINKDIIVPDEATIERIIKIYEKYGYGTTEECAYGTTIDFMSARNRYVWLYKIMYNRVKDIEYELRQSRIG